MAKKIKKIDSRDSQSGKKIRKKDQTQELKKKEEQFSCGSPAFRALMKKHKKWAERSNQFFKDSILKNEQERWEQTKKK